ncbi:MULTISPECIES: hypothetical protein [Clostridia]|jgi:hypothetical protein|uniref:hypothetical protein n=1 Tax=Clostridia TaxID=186801 RepID=UPI000E46A9F7|nr:MULTISPECIES: hypothetical protein [Clostridia]RGH41838.1 hypothetical protein DW901_02060 [Firmicutes bacterium AM41-5BH]RHV07291.1 hypothetical protein DXB97_04690 [Firmicutes bacterium OM07-11]RKQ31873.1 hypothetical protein D8Q48_01030 [Ruminococcus sp. B05]TAP36113.1 hypothetical protein EYA86_01030 [Mediterraneibacter sp. gm002]
MLDKKRIRLMVRMASYEKTNAKQDQKISSYYKKDYISLNTLITILWITIGYAIIVGLAAICGMDILFENLTIIRMLILGGLVIVGYIIVLVIYGVCASSYYKLKHNRAKQRVKRYYRDMSKLENYGKKERRS